MGETYSTFNQSNNWEQGADSEQDDWMPGHGAGHAGASRPVRRGILINSTGLPPYGTPNFRGVTKTREGKGKAIRPNRLKGSVNKPTPRGGCGYDKSKPLKSATSNKYHKAVFPGMRVPVYMRKRSKRDRCGYRSEGGVIQSSQPEYVPVMSVQCPMPGGTAVTMTTDPVQKVSWGPITRIEASEEARELINHWREALKDAKKTKDKGKVKNESDDDETDKPVKTRGAKKGNNAATVVVGIEPDEGSKYQDQEDISINNDLTPATTSQADTEATTDTHPPRRFLKPPPPTPPDTIFHKTHSQLVAAALSMPTLPTLHRISDPQLVEQYRLQHAMDRETFEKETRAIKKGLVDAKVARGGKPRLLKNEYTVELASREDAETAEKWARDQGRSFGIVDMRSRANSALAISGPGVSPGELGLKMMGGEMEASESASAASAMKEHAGPDRIEEALEQQFPSLHRTEHPATSASAEQLSAVGPEDEILTAEARRKENKSSTHPKTGTYPQLKDKPTLRNVKSQLSRLNLSEHVSKITTYGSVRHQHSVKREASDHGEKRTVKTWIEITEVYEVPAPKVLTIKDVVAAVEEESEGRDSEGEDWQGESNEEESDDSDESENYTAQKKDKGKRVKKREKLIAKSNVKAKLSAASESDEEGYASDTDFDSSSSSTTSDFDSASGHGSVHGSREEFHDPDETETEALFRSLSRFGEVNVETIAQVSSDLRALMAGLRMDGMLNMRED
ncbi:uncharacterized protein Z519_04895 [Cladophialophora bantiana CBS 173.52]|uniref:Uncharacterized protein n=1 Tax=Cladophialophora bantiana (strain ATCC 10958 / CBS 173.52 / CDC B-1940 / NIH 8579) TaxID=1442370 RepID=A0A0D2EY74_CLAB1|nr:uncharacterized protein Z519_04895 [Cladophialophora bantiana CBS 173.52]KIW94916.1 hypothetical protein Z519_04895 [Cladophialophora bantiana CBS 173.52]